MDNSEHYILNGDVDSGKSMLLFNLYHSLSGTGRLIAGWISLPHFDHDIKTGYDIIFIKNSVAEESRALARTYEFDGATKWRRFWFDMEVFNEASEMHFGTPDLFIIDEVGPLELEDHKGFWPILERVYNESPVTITAVRNSIVEDFKNSFQDYRFKLLIF